MAKPECCDDLPFSIYEKHVECFKTFIKLDPLSVNKYYNNDLPLTLAIENELDEFIAILLENGADPNKKDKIGRTFVHAVAEFGKFDYLKKFIENGSNVNEQSDSGDTPLYYCVNEKNEDKLKCAEFLIQSGAQINIKNKNGNTPLDVAMLYGNEEAIKLLLDHGAEKSPPKPQPQFHRNIFQDFNDHSNFHTVLKSHNIKSKADFKKWMLKNHPDKIKNKELVDEATRIFQEVMEASIEVGYFSN